MIEDEVYEPSIMDSYGIRLSEKQVDYMPLLELPMGIYYDEEHIWPSEKLYRYLVKTFFKRKRLRRGPLYGRSSLTCW